MNCTNNCTFIMKKITQPNNTDLRHDHRLEKMVYLIHIDEIFSLRIE